MKPVQIKSYTVPDVIARAKASQEAFNKLPPEEQEKRIKETARILAGAGTNGPTALILTKKLRKPK